MINNIYHVNDLLLTGQGVGFNISFSVLETGYSGDRCPYDSFRIQSALKPQSFIRFCGKLPQFTYIHMYTYCNITVQTKSNFPVNITMIYQPINLNSIGRADLFKKPYSINMTDPADSSFADRL